MDLPRQVVDAAIAIVVMLLAMLLLNPAAPGLGTRLGIVLACTYYFSRNPWGGDGEHLNERIDALYDAYLPV